MTPRFSVIVPVYNRRGEVDDLLASLVSQRGIAPGLVEVIVVEDGSTDPCGDICERYAGKGVEISYHFKDNEGRSPARNYGMERARGEWLIFFDSDCVAPADYFAKLNADPALDTLDCFGGPDAAHESFSNTQKAINVAMTSFLTTGGIRGGRVSMEKFTPRTFNMGFRKEVFERVGGFREMYSEDIDMSTRIRNAGFRIGLLPDQKVYHKRRIDLRKFFRQVYVFGKSRITLHLLYPGSLKVVHLFPAVFVVGVIVMCIFAIVWSWLWLIPLAVYLLAVFVSACIASRSLKVGVIAVPASVIQLGGYGLGFINAFTQKILLGRGRDITEEIEARRGK